MKGKSHIIIITHYSGLYGANISLLEYLRNTSIPANAFLLVLPGAGILEDELIKRGINYIIYPFQFNTSTNRNSSIRSLKTKLGKFKSLIGLFRKIKPYNPSLLYSNATVIYYGFLLAKIFQVKHLWHLREFGKEDYKLFHDFGFNTFKWLLQKNDANICISKCIKDYYDLSSLDNSYVIYNGIASSKQIREIKKKNYGAELRFGVIGVIKPYKHQLEVIKAFHLYLRQAKVNDKLFIIGPQGKDEYNQNILEYVHCHNLKDNVIFRGHIDNRDEIYNSLDLLIHGAKHEAFGRVTAEAMSYGVVPVGYNYGGTTEIIENGVNGYLFNNFDELPNLLKAIRKDMAGLSNLQRQLSSNFPNEFTVESNSFHIDALVRKLTGNTY